jgi:uncharacterized YccA/Bax inhibitor family protein
MSLGGIFFKTLINLLILSVSLWYVWDLVYQGVNVKWYTSGGLLAAIVFSILTSYRKKWAPITAPLYAFSKGFFLGGFSAIINKQFEGFAMQAVGVTVITFFVMLLLYQWRIIKVTKKFRSVVLSVSFTIMMIYLISWVLSFFGIYNHLLWGTSWFAIIFNIIAAIFASLTLLLDFDFIDRKLGNAPKYMEWVASWGLLVSLIWLYVEVLRLMKKLI